MNTFEKLQFHFPPYRKTNSRSQSHLLKCNRCGFKDKKTATLYHIHPSQRSAQYFVKLHRNKSNGKISSKIMYRLLFNSMCLICGAVILCTSCIIFVRLWALFYDDNHLLSLFGSPVCLQRQT